MKEFSSPSSYSSIMIIARVLVMLAVLIGRCSAHYLTTTFYDKSCPNVFSTVSSVVKSALANDRRMGASLLRLHFHDCFVQGCDASLLLNDTPSFQGEQTALPNGGIRGFDVVEAAKTRLEAQCPGIVSCADILTIAARDSVALLGGPSWDVKVGRRDSRTASFATANGGAIPLGSSDLPNLITRFRDQGLSPRDMVALSGAHTIGVARCVTFRARIYNETNIDATLARNRQANCPPTPPTGNNNLAPLDLKTPTFFDNSYFVNLLSNKGLLHSDQVLFNGNSTDTLVQCYSKNPKLFFSDFAAAMIKMGDIRPLVGSNGEIRRTCGRIN